ncbi:MAG: chromate efflux transporter [Alphaproteobacteria bacterium]|nr:chromate efflux transporter [Alphaproteobacteria bacterium]
MNRTTNAQPGGGSASRPARHRPVWEIFLVFLRLGLTSFGGPIAHLGYFRDEFVHRRKWLDDRSYADLVALCQFTPGAASSKVGIGIGLSMGGLPGAVAAWVAFTLPSALALVLFGYGVTGYGDVLDAGFLHGLKVVAVAVVAFAVWGMARNLCPDAPRFTVAVGAVLVFGLWPTSLGQIAAIVTGGLVGLVFFRQSRESDHTAMRAGIGRLGGAISLFLFFALLLGLPALAALMPQQSLALFDSFYRSGSLVFGGGHVVLPLLQAETVPPGWVGNDTFLAGYGAAQAVPGPLFTFAGYLGVVMSSPPNGWLGAVICLVAIFLPSFLLTVGALPFWEELRRVHHVRAILTGVNAAVVGLLLAALYDPVWTSAIHKPADFGLAVTAFALLAFWKVAPWLVVLLTAFGGWGIASLQGVI